LLNYDLLIVWMLKLGNNGVEFIKNVNGGVLYIALVNILVSDLCIDESLLEVHAFIVMLSLMNNVNGGVILHCFGEIRKWGVYSYVGVDSIQ